MWPLGGARLLSPAEEGRRTAGLVRGTSFLVSSMEKPLSSHLGLTRLGPAQAPDGWASSLSQAFPSCGSSHSSSVEGPPRGAGLARVLSQLIIASTAVRGLG